MAVTRSSKPFPAVKEYRMLRKISPETVFLPVPNYVGATYVKGQPNWLYISGQVGIAKDGSCPADLKGQTGIALDNIRFMLADVGMNFDNIVKLNFFVKEGEDVDRLREARNERMNLVPVASTIVYISGLVRDDLLVEIDLVAAG